MYVQLCSLYCSKYFVEYNFPVVGPSRDKHGSTEMATEAVRVVSKDITDGGILLTLTMGLLLASINFPHY